MVLTGKDSVTFVMSVLNGKKEHVERAIRSVLEQVHSDFDFIIVDNGSEPSTAECLRNVPTLDDRVRVLRNERPLLLVESRQMAIDAASGDWIALMDADDICEPRRLERQLQVARSYPAQIGAVGTWAHYINDEGSILGNMIMPPNDPRQFTMMYRRNSAISLVDSSALIHKNTFLQVGGYRREYTPAADLDLWYRIAESGKMILVIPEFLMQYRVHLGSDSVRKTLLQRKATHFINYNMRLRRAGKREISHSEFETQVWSRPLYRLPRLRKDLAMMFYKRAGLAFGARNPTSLGTNLLAATLLSPSIVAKRIWRQKLSAWAFSGK